MGYVIQYKIVKGDFFHKLIYNIQKKAGFSDEDAKYVHCEISCGENHSVYAHPPHATFIDILKVHAHQEYRIMRPKVYDTDDLDRKRIKVALISATYNNEPYDILGILRFRLGFIFSSKRAKFCSEGCASAIQSQFPEFFGEKPPYNFYPAHFCDPIYMNVVDYGIIES